MKQKTLQNANFFRCVKIKFAKYQFAKPFKLFTNFCITRNFFYIFETAPPRPAPGAAGGPPPGSDGPALWPPEPPAPPSAPGCSAAQPPAHTSVVSYSG